MFKFLKKLFAKTRLIERYNSLGEIIDAHNDLIRKTAEVFNDMSPAHLASRLKAIQDSEEKAVGAYWRNKDSKADRWVKRPEKEMQEATEVSVANTEQTAQQIAVEPPPEALNAAPVGESAAPVPAESVQLPADNVIEIHINK